MHLLCAVHTKVTSNPEHCHIRSLTAEKALLVYHGIQGLRPQVGLRRPNIHDLTFVPSFFFFPPPLSTFFLCAFFRDTYKLCGSFIATWRPETSWSEKGRSWWSVISAWRKTFISMRTTSRRVKDGFRTNGCLSRLSAIVDTQHQVMCKFNSFVADSTHKQCKRITYLICHYYLRVQNFAILGFRRFCGY